MQYLANKPGKAIILQTPFINKNCAQYGVDSALGEFSHKHIIDLTLFLLNPTVLNLAHL